MATIEKKGNWSQQINNQTRGEFFSLLLRHNMCPECVGRQVLGTLERHEDELVCTTCGFVVEHEHFSSVIPFGSERTVSKHIAFEDGLGGTLGLKGTRAMAWKMSEKKPFKCGKCGYEGGYTCPKCGHETNDYPLRANQLQLVSQNFEHPKIRTLKKLGSLRAKDFGFDDRRGGKGSVFMEYFVDRAKKVTAHYILQNARISVQKLADVCFALTARDLLGPVKFEEIKKRLNLQDKDVENFGVIYQTQARKLKV
jgi:ribosomal protein S27AE